MYVIASGASAPEAVARMPWNATALVVNRGFELAPWADALYAADLRFWNGYSKAKHFAGLKFSATPRAGTHLVNIAHDGIVRVDRPVRSPVGTVGGAGNSGFQAVNLAAQFGARRIVLIGFDMSGKHWHADHGHPMANPRSSTLAEWRASMDAAAAVYAEWGVEVLNASRISALTAYPFVDLEAVCHA